MIEEQVDRWKRENRVSVYFALIWVSLAMYILFERRVHRATYDVYLNHGKAVLWSLNNLKHFHLPKAFGLEWSRHRHDIKKLDVGGTYPSSVFIGLPPDWRSELGLKKFRQKCFISCIENVSRYLMYWLYFLCVICILLSLLDS